MNSLSWLIYWASVVGSLNGFLTFIAVALGFATAGAWIIFVVGVVNKTSGENVKEWNEVFPLISRYRNRFMGAFLVASAAVIFVPDKQTIVMIGASEFGQRIVQSEAVQRLADPSVTYIENWLRTEIERMTGSINNNQRR